MKKPKTPKIIAELGTQADSQASPVKFAVKIQIEECPRTQVQLSIGPEAESNDPEFIEPMFDNSDVLFLAKPSDPQLQKQKRLITSVDLDQERLEKLNNSRTMEPSKKIFQRRAKRKLKLNLKKLNRSFEEVPTAEKELSEIRKDAER